MPPTATAHPAPVGAADRLCTAEVAEAAHPATAYGDADALPTSFQRAPSGAPRSGGDRPVGREALQPFGIAQVGCADQPVVGIQIAGGDGIPIVEPPLSVGTASTASRAPGCPSVQ